MTWTKGEGWSDRRVAVRAAEDGPGASVLHYAQECFAGSEGLSSRRRLRRLFRPDANAERFQNSAKRLYLPELPIDDFIGSVAAPVKRDVNWVPSRRRIHAVHASVHVRPEPFLGGAPCRRWIIA